jgi:hypothetical protein
MNQMLEELLDAATSSEPHTREEAVLQLSLLLERSNTVEGPDSAYAGLLLPGLMHLRLTEEEQRDVVECLRSLSNSPKSSPSILAALGKASPKVGIEPLLSLIKEGSAEFDSETAYQAVIALDNFLVRDGDGQFIPEVAHQLRECSPATFLERMSRAGDPRLARHAHRVLDIIRSHELGSP